MSFSVENQHPKPSYYAIIPANVRYCKALEPAAKLLYGEITALCQKEGFCWATNKYFSELYDVDESTVKRWLASLKVEKFIFLDVEKNGIQTQRKIWISLESKRIYTEAQKCAPGGSKMNPGGLKNEPPSQANNLLINNKYKNTKEEETLSRPPPIFSYKKVKMKREEYENLVKDFGEEKVKDYIERLDAYGEQKAKKFKEYTSHSAVIRTWIRKDSEKISPEGKSISQEEEWTIVNRNWAREFKKIGDYDEMIILPKYVRDANCDSKEWSLNLPPATFQEAVGKYFFEKHHHEFEEQFT